MEMKEYELVNKEGCLMDSVMTTSFRKAREYFNDKFWGNYKILCEGERKNVRL